MQKSFCSKLFLILVTIFMVISTVSGQQNFTPQSYIDTHRAMSQQLMKETGVPASVILAVAIHESAYGNSRIAKHLNNHFGIKGKNNSKTIKSAYKGYSSTSDSYDDFIAFLKRRNSTKVLFDKYSSTDYKSWIKGISRSGYSATKGWSSKILSTISRYNLSQYDSKS